jgi:hypothetical protein
MEIFGRSRGEEMARIAGAPLLARIPIDTELVHLIDRGKIEEYNSPLFDSLTKNIPRVLKR